MTPSALTSTLPNVPALVPAAERARLQNGERTEMPLAHGNLVWHCWTPEPHLASGAPPVVLFHGGSGSWTHWVKNILPLVDAGRRVLAVDLPGFGDSDAPAEGTDADAMVEPLADGLRGWLGGQAADLVGFSLGGMTAGMLLAAHPALAQRLVLVGAPAMGVVPRPQYRLKAWRHLTSADEQREIHRHNLSELMLHDPALIDGLALELHIANVHRDRLPRRRLSRTDILARSLTAVRCPVHAIYGAHDVLYRGHLSALRNALAAAAPDFRGLDLIEGAGHWVQYEAPQGFDAALRAVLNSPVSI